MKKLLLTILALVACVASWAQTDLSGLTQVTTTAGLDLTGGTFYVIKFVNSGKFVRCDGTTVTLSDEVRAEDSDVFCIESSGDANYPYKLKNKATNKYINYTGSTYATVDLQTTAIPVKFEAETNGLRIRRNGESWRYLWPNTSNNNVEFRTDVSGKTTTVSTIANFDVVLYRASDILDGLDKAGNTFYHLQCSDDSYVCAGSATGEPLNNHAYIDLTTCTDKPSGLNDVFCIEPITPAPADNYKYRLKTKDGKYLGYHDQSTHPTVCLYDDASIAEKTNGTETRVTPVEFIKQTDGSFLISRDGSSYKYINRVGTELIYKGSTSNGNDAKFRLVEVPKTTSIDPAKQYVLQNVSNKGIYVASKESATASEEGVQQTSSFFTADKWVFVPVGDGYMMYSTTRDKLFCRNNSYHWEMANATRSDLAYKDLDMSVLHKGDGKWALQAQRNTIQYPAKNDWRTLRISGTSLDANENGGDAARWYLVEAGDATQAHADAVYQICGLSTQENRVGKFYNANSNYYYYDSEAGFVAYPSAVIKGAPRLLYNSGRTSIGLAAADDNNPTSLATDVPVTFNVAAQGYATLFTPVALDVPEGVKAYTGTIDAANGVITLTSKSTIPAGTAVLLKAQSEITSETPAFTFTINTETNTETNTDTNADEANCFTGRTTSHAVEQGTVLTLGLNSGNIGFYSYQGTQVRGFSSYINKNAHPELSGSNVRGFALSFSDNLATDIETVLTAEAAGAAYDISGRRVEKASNGIYILNGKKIIIK